jgi:ketosteroid isomerase-like protein
MAASDDTTDTLDSAAGAAAATSSTAGDARQAVDEAMARYIDAVERGDTAAIAASFTDEAILVMPSGRAMKGRSEVNKAFVDMLATSSVEDLPLAH